MPCGIGRVAGIVVSESFTNVIWENFDGAWFGKEEDGSRYAEFQMASGNDNSVRLFSMRRTGRREVEMSCRQLDIVAVDPRKMELYSRQTGTWWQER